MGQETSRMPLGVWARSKGGRTQQSNSIVRLGLSNNSNFNLCYVKEFWGTTSDVISG